MNKREQVELLHRLTRWKHQAWIEGNFEQHTNLQVRIMGLLKGVTVAELKRYYGGEGVIYTKPIGLNGEDEK